MGYGEKCEVTADRGMQFVAMYYELEHSEMEPQDTHNLPLYNKTCRASPLYC